MQDPEYLYPAEKFGVAVYALVGSGGIRDRLETAYISISPLSPSDLPDHLQAKYQKLREGLTWLPVEEPGEGRLRATLREMNDDEADRLAKQFFDLYVELLSISYRTR